jgi:hypothetical protein
MLMIETASPSKLIGGEPGLHQYENPGCEFGPLGGGGLEITTRNWFRVSA